MLTAHHELLTNVAVRHLEVVHGKARDAVRLELLMLHGARFLDPLHDLLDRGVQEEGTEHEEDPDEPLNDSRTDEDEDEAHHQRHDDAIEQHLLLVLSGNAERGDDNDEHEDVIKRERLLREVPGKIFAGERAAVTHVEHTAVDDGEADIDEGPDPRLFQTGLVLLTHMPQQVEEDKCEDDERQCAPLPRVHNHFSRG